MATRREVQQRKASLKEGLRQSYIDGTLTRGEMAPSLRLLAEQYDVSTKVVTQSLQELAEEGLLHTVARVGTFVGPRLFLEREHYLVLLDEATESPYEKMVHQMQLGFDDRIAERGGAVLVMDIREALGASSPQRNAFAGGRLRLDGLCCNRRRMASGRKRQKLRGA